MLRCQSQVLSYIGWCHNQAASHKFCPTSVGAITKWTLRCQSQVLSYIWLVLQPSERYAASHKFCPTLVDASTMCHNAASHKFCPTSVGAITKWTLRCQSQVLSYIGWCHNQAASHKFCPTLVGATTKLPVTSSVLHWLVLQPSCQSQVLSYTGWCHNQVNVTLPVTSFEETIKWDLIANR